VLTLFMAFVKHAIREGMFDVECRGFETMADHMAIAAIEKGTGTEVLHCMTSNFGPCEPRPFNSRASSPESVSMLERSREH